MQNQGGNPRERAARVLYDALKVDQKIPSSTYHFDDYAWARRQAHASATKVYALVVTSTERSRSNGISVADAVESVAKLRLRMLRQLDETLWKDLFAGIGAARGLDEVDPDLLDRLDCALEIQVCSSAELVVVDQQILGLDPPSNEFEVQPVPLLLKASIKETDTEAQDTMFRRLLQSVVTSRAAASLLNQESTDGLTRRLRSRVMEVGLTNRNRCTLSAKALEIMERSVQHGVPISEVRDFQLEDVTSPVVRSLRAVFCVETKIQSTLSRGAQSLSITDSPWSSVHLGLLSAAQISQSLDYVELEIQLNPALMSTSELAERRKLWQWIAFAFFSRDARHKIRELSLDASWISMADVEAMREVIDADDPLAFVFGVESMKHRLLIRSHCFYLTKPNEFSPQARRVEFEKEVVARVLTHREHDDGWWWTVVLPGCGHAWVKEEDAVSENDEAELGESRRSIRKVTIENMSDRTKPVVMSFLETVKDSVTTIELGSEGVYIRWTSGVFNCLVHARGWKRSSYPTSLISTIFPLLPESLNLAVSAFARNL